MNHFVPTGQTRLSKLTKKMVDTDLVNRPSSEMLRRLELELGGRQSATTGGKFYRNQILRRLSTMVGGCVKIVESGSVCWLGNQEDHSSDDNSPTILVNDRQFFKRTFWGGTIGAAESYIDGQWNCNDLTSLVRLMIRNLSRFNRLESTWAYFQNRLHFFRHLLRRNTVSGSRKNIHDHYDLGNDFYQLFLDPTMNYSSGIFETSDPRAEDRFKMHDASNHKMETLCRRLDLTADDHVLEIGTGWGGLAIYMASNFGCRVTTCTISKEQYLLARSRIRQAGLDDRIEVQLKDYRHLDGQYDKIVSVEMIEAVGHQYYDEFFAKCESLLTERGRLLLQAITIGEQSYQAHIRKVDFIRKYVFPGGCLPSVSALSRSIGRSTSMRMVHQLDITAHYVKTLFYWRTQFLSKLEQVRELGYDEKFIRLWNFYLCYCEAAFAERRVHCTHLMYGKPGIEL